MFLASLYRLEPRARLIIMFNSSQVEALFSKSHETIRAWAQEFRDWLSPTANPEKGRARQYSESDLEVFALISEMKAQGRLFSDIKAALGAGQRGDIPQSFAVVPSERGKLAALQRQINEMQAALSSALENNQHKDGRIEELTRQLEDLKAENKALNREIGRLESRIDPPV